MATQHLLPHIDGHPVTKGGDVNETLIGVQSTFDSRANCIERSWRLRQLTIRVTHAYSFRLSRCTTWRSAAFLSRGFPCRLGICNVRLLKPCSSRKFTCR